MKMDCNTCPDLDFCLEKADFDNDKEWHEKCEKNCPHQDWEDDPIEP